MEETIVKCGLSVSWSICKANVNHTRLWHMQDAYTGYALIVYFPNL